MPYRISTTKLSWAFDRPANFVYRICKSWTENSFFRSSGHGGRGRRARVFNPFLLFPFAFFLCFAATPARAVNAVVTFTNGPSLVGNTYNGVITLQINGLTNGVTNVVVQKFLDVNTNGVIDPSDLLVQQFQLTAGQTRVFTDVKSGAPVTVTNFMPGDISSVPGQMTVPLNFQNGDFFQSLVGQYLYRISSPSGLFAPVTSSFVVTNTFYSSLATGIVVNASTGLTNAPVTNSIVLLCVNQAGLLNVMAGTVAKNNGAFSLRVPPGDYFVLATKTNFLEENARSYSLSLSAKQTNGPGGSGYVYLIPGSITPGSANVTGRIINAANSNGLAGVSGVLLDTNNDFSFFFTDTNGNLSAPVTISNSWQTQVNPFAATFQGFLTWQTNLWLNITNKSVSFTNALPPANAIFYGVVSNSAAEPLPGVYMYSIDTASHQSMGMTDQHGKYVVDALAETNEWEWAILATNNPGITNTEVFSPGYVGAIGVQTNDAVQQSFSLLFAPYTISGTVSDADGNPIVGAVIFATNGTDEAFSSVTGTGGVYSLDVSSGSWTVGIVPASLQILGYTNFPANQTATVSDADPNVTVNFTIVACNEIEILTTNLPDAVVGDYYETNLEAESCQNVTNWFPAYGVTLTSLYDHTNVTYPAGTPIYSDSLIIGYSETYFSFALVNNQKVTSNCTATLVQDSAAGNEHYYFSPISATVNLTGPITNTIQIQFGAGNNPVWTASNTTQNADGSYSATVTLSRWPPYPTDWFVNGNEDFYAGSLVYNESSGTPSNRVGSVIGDFHSIPTVGNSGIVASSRPYTNLDNSVVWITYGTNTGQYFISAYGMQSTNLPPGLSLLPNGTIEGTPTATTTNGTFNFSVAAEDTAGNITVQPLSMFVYPGTAITGPSSSQAGMLQSSNVFQMQVTGVESGFGYTVLMTTNLSPPNWVPIYTTNAVNTNSFIVPDAAATNTARFYRLEISPPGS